MSEKGNWGEEIIDYFANTANVSFKNPILDVLKELVCNIDVESTFRYYQLNNDGADDNFINEHFPDLKEGTADFSVFNLEEAHAMQGFNNSKYVPLGALTISIKYALLAHIKSGAPKMESLNAQRICLVLYYKYFANHRDEYVDRLSWDEDSRAVMNAYVDNFFEFFKKYPAFTEYCETKKIG